MIRIRRLDDDECQLLERPTGGKKPMNIFEAVKESVTAREAAERYGIKVNRNSLARCRFHDDRIPSMKIDKRYYCFGCQAKGDVIDFTSKLFGLSARDAAMKLAKDFNISYDGEIRPAAPESACEGEPDDRRFLDAIWKCATVYIDYLSLLKRWRTEYAPAEGEYEWHPLFKEALQEEAHVEYILDVLMNGSLDDVTDLIIDVGKEVNDLEKRIEGLNAG